MGCMNTYPIELRQRVVNAVDSNVGTKKENRKRLRLIYHRVKGLTKEGVWVIVNFRGAARQNYSIKIGLRTKN